MVASRVPFLGKAHTFKPFGSALPLTVSIPEILPVDHDEFDFSDVFGPASLSLSCDTNEGNPENIASPHDPSDLVYDDPVVIHKRSHSLVGPSLCVSQSLKLSMLTLHEVVDSDESLKCENVDTIEQHSDSSTDAAEDIAENNDTLLHVGKVGLEDFEIMKVVGQGAFGKVFQVRKKGTAEIFAMKVMRKDKITEQNHAEYMKAERDILTQIDHPFVVQLRWSFQTKYRLYLVLDFINGGHLFFQLYNQGLFREELARVYAAEIVSAVSHLHANGIMHRDLKPENILLGADGHVILTDFGLAKQFQQNERSNSMCGTVEYMAPEIVMGKGHDKAADWWSVGILIFEMLTGKPPFSGGNREKVQKKIIKDKMKLPAFLSSEAHSLLKGLLQKEPGKRLGSEIITGSDEIKRHKWFKAINWKKLEAREIQPSFCPDVSGQMCIANFDKCWTDMSVNDSPATSPSADGNLIFKNFTYVRPAASFLQNELHA